MPYQSLFVNIHFSLTNLTWTIVYKKGQKAINTHTAEEKRLWKEHFVI